MLTSYEATGHHWVIVVWSLVLVNITLTVPLLFQRSRQSLLELLEPFATVTNAPSLYYIMTILLLAFVATCGTLLRRLDVIMMFRESTTGVLLMFVLPAVMLSRLSA